MILVFNKPFDVLCQFTDADGRNTLKDYIDINTLYPAGRLDRDSEGLLVLTDNGKLQGLISHPRYKLAKRYLVQVEGVPTAAALQQLAAGVELNDGRTQPASARLIDEPDLWPRDPPVRYRANIPTRWLELIIREGKNRQVRRMTAAVGYPTLRLVRDAVGPLALDGLQPGESREIPLAALLDNPQLSADWRKMAHRILQQPDKPAVRRRQKFTRSKPARR